MSKILLLSDSLDTRVAAINTVMELCKDQRFFEAVELVKIFFPQDINMNESSFNTSDYLIDPLADSPDSRSVIVKGMDYFNDSIMFDFDQVDEKLGTSEIEAGKSLLAKNPANTADYMCKSLVEFADSKTVINIAKELDDMVDVKNEKFMYLKKMLFYSNLKLNDSLSMQIIDELKQRGEEIQARYFFSQIASAANELSKRETS